MDGITTLVVLMLVVLLAILEATMPKPRSSLPSIVTLIAIILLVILAILQSQHIEFVPDKYLIWVLVALVFIPIALTIYTLRKEKLSVILGKLDTDSRLIVENIVDTLQQIYLNEKTIARTLSADISEDKVTEMYSEIMKVLGLRIISYMPHPDDEVTVRTVMKLLLYAARDIVVIVIIVGLSHLFPYFIREMRFLRVAAVPDVLEIGLNSIEGTDKDLNQTLKMQLLNASKMIRTEKSVNVIQKCLKYSHATNNLYLIELLASKQAILSNKVRLYAELTRRNPDHLMSQRFAEVARAVSNELVG